MAEVRQPPVPGEELLGALQVPAVAVRRVVVLVASWIALLLPPLASWLQPPKQLARVVLLPLLGLHQVESR